MTGSGGAVGRINLRSALRQAFRFALEACSRDGVAAISPDELPGLVEQVR